MHLLICLWLFFVSLPPSQDLAGRLATGFNRLGVGVLVGPQFKINDGNTTESKARIYCSVMTNNYASVWAAKWLVSMYCTAVYSTLSLTRMLSVVISGAAPSLIRTASSLFSALGFAEDRGRRRLPLEP